MQAVAQLPGLPRTVAAAEVLAGWRSGSRPIAASQHYIAAARPVRARLRSGVAAAGRQPRATDFLVQHPILHRRLLDGA